MDKLTAMRAFMTVADQGSFAAAARQLGLSRSQLNRQVLWLEDHLQVTLFNRTTRRVSLTHTGKAYLENIVPLLDNLHDTEAQLQQGQTGLRGVIKVNAPMSFGLSHLTPAVLAFMQQYPDIRVQLELSDEKRDPLSNQFDVTLRIGKPESNPALIEHDITHTSRRIVASPDFLAKYGEPTEISQLATLPCLQYGSLLHGNYWDLMHQRTAMRVKINGVLSSNNGDVLKQAALQGRGLAFLPTFIVGDAIGQGALIPVLEAYQPEKLVISLIYPPNRHMALRLSVFVKFMQDAFEDNDFIVG
ncbi:DNA-binding transcriptional regulator, LysR family [Marisediminitalea aggregata]|uniref:DNA-binding transcriptional regulator, LysR family n=1 Tax=Marisediminitalea aggregata TaxID=634436 RepID=A0A1M5HLA4_9ALTE|nr:LysR family transcriptional regulator [Marisediminitalea aggregata]SHG16678.1 DNA-binding transcriptional regulator, LysR family [Marisediminitalea aggregata]